MASDATGLAECGAQAPESEAVSGAGTEFVRLLSAARVSSSALLRDGRARQMDSWGTDGCKRRRREILGWLRDEHRKQTWAERTAAAARMIATLRPTLGGTIDMLGDPFEAVFDVALRRAEEGIAPPASHGELKARALQPLAMHRLDETNLAPGVAGPRFNASIARLGGRAVLAWRNLPVRSRIYLTELNRRLGATENTRLLDLEHHFSGAGKDDPRLFVFRDRLHVSFTGVHELDVKYSTTAHMLYAELDEAFATRQVFMPDYRHRADWEKNWTFFECDGALYAVYSVRPHRVLAVNRSSALVVHETPWNTPWQGGLHRGGASPVRVGDQFYCFFHGARLIDGERTYTAGVYTFEAKPPFRVTRCTRWPILVPNPATRPAGVHADVIYPCGAFLDGERWIVSCGVHDSWIEIHEFDAGEIEKRLEMIL